LTRSRTAARSTATVTDPHLPTLIGILPGREELPTSIADRGAKVNRVRPAQLSALVDHPAALKLAGP
jgi:hypothetical protein